MTPDVMAVCTDCPALVVGAMAVDLVPLMDEHYDATGHRLWAYSSHPPEGR